MTQGPRRERIAAHIQSITDDLAQLQRAVERAPENERPAAQEAITRAQQSLRRMTSEIAGLILDE
jgi:hypothetical protein